MSKNSFSKLAEEDGDDLPTINRVHSAPLAEVPLEDLNPHRAELSLVEKDKPAGESHTSNWIFVSAFFIIVSTILGTGILGLPIKIAKTGFQPFLLGYSITCLMQAFTLIYTVEVLQRSHALNRASHTSAEARSWLPDLHSLGQQYLHPWLRAVFDASVMVHFVSILITYALAGTQAYVQLLSGREPADNVVQYAAIPFVCILTALLVFGYEIIHQVISAMTLIKGSLLTLLVLVTGYIAIRVSHKPENDWKFIGSPLLVGTVALGGGMNLLPFIYAKLVGFTRRDMQRLTIASVAALVFVYFLNVLWCYYLLHIVPQPDLITSGDEGHISTVPLMDVIKNSYPSLKWLGLIVQIFVASSITVSFITVGTGLKHTLDGIAHSFTSPDSSHDDLHWSTTIRRFAVRRLGSRFNSTTVGYALYVVFYGLVLAVAELNPESFFIVLEHVTSLALNLESGVFVVLMLEIARVDAMPIPWNLPPWLYNFRWAVLLFFLFACVYNLIDLLIHRLIV